MQNPYIPYPVRIDDITVEAEDKSLKTFKFVFLNEGDEEKFAYRAGQFAELSIPGKGEIPIGIASSPVGKRVRQVHRQPRRGGHHSPAQHARRRSDGPQRPLGQLLPMGSYGRQEHSDRRRWVRFHHPALVHRLHARSGQPVQVRQYRCGLRGPQPGHAAVQRRVGGNGKNAMTSTCTSPLTVLMIRTGNTMSDSYRPSPSKRPRRADADTYAIVCGPPIMIKFTQPVLEKLGYAPRSHHHEPGKPHEMRVRHVRPLRYRQGTGLQGRAGIHPGSDQFKRLESIDRILFIIIFVIVIVVVIDGITVHRKSDNDHDHDYEKNIEFLSFF